MPLRELLPALEMRGATARTGPWEASWTDDANVGIERETFIREVPVRRIQVAGAEDGGAQGGEGRREEQLGHRLFKGRTEA